MCEHFVVHLQLSLSAEYFQKKMPPKFHLRSLISRLLLVRIDPFEFKPKYNRAPLVLVYSITSLHRSDP